MSDSRVDGFADKSFESVRLAYLQNFERYDELGSALCVKLNGTTVVDLKAGPVAVGSNRPWNSRTLVNVWSTTKGITAICFAMLVSRGLLSYEDCVADYWPEFAANKKSHVTVADLLSHKAGMAALSEGVSIQALLDPSAAELMAEAVPLWPPGHISGYHILTYGPLVAELFRRIEGRSLTQFVAQEFFRARGWDIHIGLPEERDSDVAEITVSETLDLSIRENASMLQHRVFTSPFLEPLDANTRAWKRAELPSANGFSNAAAIAELYAAVIDPDGSLLSANALQEATRTRYEGSDLILTIFSRWAAGFALNTQGVYGPNPGAFGHSGMGGSFGFADPDSGIAMSYTPNRMGYRLRADPRAQALVDAVYACIR